MIGPPWLHGRFRNAGFRLTLPRQAILNIFAENLKHLSAEAPIRQCLVKNISVSRIQRVIARTVKKRRLPGFLFGWNFTYRGFGMAFREF